MPAIPETSRPQDYDGLNKTLRSLRKRYPFIQCFSIGKSVLGRDICACIIGPGKPQVLFVGGHHALEYITSLLLLTFVEDLCAHYQSGRDLLGLNVRESLAKRSLCVVPMLNPDGVELHLKGIKSAGPLKEELKKIAGDDFSGWQANAHGVDLNHNYNAGWELLRQMEASAGILGPSPRRYGGTRPESEPETHALCNFCRRIQFSRAYSLHSQGEEIYWCYGTRTPKISYEIAKKLSDKSGYRLSQPEGLASHGGFKDWFIKVFAKPAFTMEVGIGKNPLPLSDLENIYAKILGMLLAAVVL